MEVNAQSTHSRYRQSQTKGSLCNRAIQTSICFEGLPTPFSDNGTMHHVTIGGLQPNRSYEASQLGSVRILQHGGDSRIE